MENLFSRFIESEGFQEYVYKLSKITLALFLSSEKKKKQTGGGIKKVKNQKSKYSEENEIEIMNAQKRALMIEMMKSIIQLRCFQLNNDLKPIIVQVYVQLKTFQDHDNKGILTLLNLLGNPTEIVDEVEAQTVLETNGDRDPWEIQDNFAEENNNKNFFKPTIGKVKNVIQLSDFVEEETAGQNTANRREMKVNRSLPQISKKDINQSYNSLRNLEDSMDEIQTKKFAEKNGIGIKNKKATNEKELLYSSPQINQV